MITLEKARKSEIGHIFSNHDSLFKANTDREFLILLVFLMYEHQKGEASLWFPYFNAVNPDNLSSYWPETYLDRLDDWQLKSDLATYKQELDDDWDLL